VKAQPTPKRHESYGTISSQMLADVPRGTGGASLRTCCEVRETSSHIFALRQDLLLILNSWADTSFGRFRNDDYENWEPLDAVLFAGSEKRNFIQLGRIHVVEGPTTETTLI